MTTDGTSNATPTDAVRSLHRSVLEAWNGFDAPAFAALFADDGTR